MYEGRVRQPGSDTKVYVGSSSSMTYMASRVPSAKGQDVSARKRRKCLRRVPDDSMERFRLLAELFKEWVPRDLVGAIQIRRAVFHDDGERPRDFMLASCWAVSVHGGRQF